MRKTKLFERSVLAAVGVAIPVFLTKLLAPEPIIVDFECEPWEGKAPLQVTCTSASENASRLRWDFGGDASLKEGLVAEHTFDQPGSHTVLLTAYNGEDQRTRPREVTVLQADDWEPFEVTLVGVTHADSVSVDQSFPVFERKSRHPNPFSSDTRAYEPSYPASEGFRIVEARFEVEEMTNCSPPRVEIVDDGRAVVLRFELTSGPKVDRTDGWLDGVLHTRQEKPVPSREEVLAEGLTVAREDELSIPGDRSLDLYGELLVKDANGRVLASSTPGGTLRLESRGVALRVTERVDGLSLIAQKLG